MSKISETKNSIFYCMSAIVQCFFFFVSSESFFAGLNIPESLTITILFSDKNGNVPVASIKICGSKWFFVSRSNIKKILNWSGCGKITIKIESVKTEADSYAVITISDTGVGIPKENINKIVHSIGQ